MFPLRPSSNTPRTTTAQFSAPQTLTATHLQAQAATPAISFSAGGTRSSVTPATASAVNPFGQAPRLTSPRAPSPSLTFLGLTTLLTASCNGGIVAGGVFLSLLTTAYLFRHRLSDRYCLATSRPHHLPQSEEASESEPTTRVEAQALAAMRALAETQIIDCLLGKKTPIHKIAPYVEMLLLEAGQKPSQTRQATIGLLAWATLESYQATQAAVITEQTLHAKEVQGILQTIVALVLDFGSNDELAEKHVMHSAQDIAFALQKGGNRAALQPRPPSIFVLAEILEDPRKLEAYLLADRNVADGFRDASSPHEALLRRALRRIDDARKIITNDPQPQSIQAEFDDLFQKLTNPAEVITKGLTHTGNTLGKLTTAYANLLQFIEHNHGKLGLDFASEKGGASFLYREALEENARHSLQVATALVGTTDRIEDSLRLIRSVMENYHYLQKLDPDFEIDPEVARTVRKLISRSFYEDFYGKRYGIKLRPKLPRPGDSEIRDSADQATNDWSRQLLQELELRIPSWESASV